MAAVEARRWERLIAEGARNIAEGQASGVVASKLNNYLLAAMVLGAVRAAVTTQVAENPGIDPGKLADQIWRFLGSGLGLEA